MRAAIYFTPPAAHPLTEAAALWLGRDAFTGEARSFSARDGENERDIREITAEPRRYGFHATIKAPFRLAANHSLAELDAALADFCRSAKAPAAPTLCLRPIGSFFALTAPPDAAGVAASAAAVVTSFDSFRAPLAPDELARRRTGKLSPAQDRYLEQWGYPYVLDEYRFHLTLTGPIASSRQPSVHAILEKRFGEFVGKPIAIDALAVFVQPRPGADFTVHSRHPLSGLPA
jgi:putative phosphonate metabolism protein